MTSFQLTSIIISSLALIISIITAYKTFFAKFQTKIFVRPRIILTGINRKPSIVIGCEIFNNGVKSGSINDMILLIKYQQENPRNVEKYTFRPILIRDNYNIYQRYQNTDFQTFESISILPKSCLVKYVVFNPSNENFSVKAGEAEIKLYFRNYNESNWQMSSSKITLKIKEENINTWFDPQNESVIIETRENNEIRNKFMEKEFR